MMKDLPKIIYSSSLNGISFKQKTSTILAAAYLPLLPCICLFVFCPHHFRVCPQPWVHLHQGRPRCFGIARVVQFLPSCSSRGFRNFLTTTSHCMSTTNSLTGVQIWEVHMGLSTLKLMIPGPFSQLGSFLGIFLCLVLLLPILQCWTRCQFILLLPLKEMQCCMI